MGGPGPPLPPRYGAMLSDIFSLFKNIKVKTRFFDIPRRAGRLFQTLNGSFSLLYHLSFFILCRRIIWEGLRP